MKKRAFSIIELLVVIAIVVILAGMLVPVYKIAREKGKLEREKRERMDKSLDKETRDKVERGEADVVGVYKVENYSGGNRVAVWETWGEVSEVKSGHYRFIDYKTRKNVTVFSDNLVITLQGEEVRVKENSSNFKNDTEF
jgi:prepilin-type N-terminal cleavage/methylation domain-containing protein